jgi:hypothetical protein
MPCKCNRLAFFGCAWPLRGLYATGTRVQTKRTLPTHDRAGSMALVQCMATYKYPKVARRHYRFPRAIFRSVWLSVFSPWCHVDVLDVLHVIISETWSEWQASIFANLLKTITCKTSKHMSSRQSDLAMNSSNNASTTGMHALVVRGLYVAFLA